MVCRRPRAVAIAILLSLLATPVWAGLEEATAALKRGDYETALRELRPLAERGNADAQYSLGVMYYEGHGVPQDHAEEVRWYRKAANQGYAEAQYDLGVMYDKGEGVPQDYVQAHMWFNLAALRLPPGTDHAKAVKNRDAIAKLMTPAQIAEAKRLAREWTEKHNR